MSTYERSGRAVVPQWWLDKVIPILDGDGVSHDEVARLASEHAGRKSPWNKSAISKFKKGDVRTIELANGISAALGVPQPFFTAPTEAAAIEMTLAMTRALKDSTDAVPDRQEVAQRKVLSVIDRVAERELDKAKVELQRKDAVPSRIYGSESGRGVRSRRPGGRSS